MAQLTWLSSHILLVHCTNLFNPKLVRPLDSRVAPEEGYTNRTDALAEHRDRLRVDRAGLRHHKAIKWNLIPDLASQPTKTKKRAKRSKKKKVKMNAQRRLPTHRRPAKSTADAATGRRS